MSEETKSAPDISKVISVIMENPDILERISSLVKNDAESKSEGSDQAPQAVAQTSSTYSEAIAAPGRTRRAQLLGALKPYVKEERARAIDSVIAIADILDMMRRK